MVKIPVPPPPSVLAGLVRSHVLVSLNTMDDEGYQGLLWAADDTGVLLVTSARGPVLYLKADQDEPVEVDGGRMFIPDGMVKAMQIMEPGSG